MNVFILNTGTSNLASVISVFKKLGCAVTVGTNKNDIADSGYMVLPGVGTFKAAMAQINKMGLADAIRERITSGKPTFAICLGFQLLFEESEENPEIKGLGVISQKIKRFSRELRVPHMGWNKVQTNNAGLIQDGYAYFANSYCLMDDVDGWNKAFTIYGDQKFVSALCKGKILACQFHPELSGKWGVELIERWLEQGAKNVDQ
jgi:imidazole glycerol-phosphate synthase subunit HisH